MSKPRMHAPAAWIEESPTPPALFHSSDLSPREGVSMGCSQVAGNLTHCASVLLIPNLHGGLWHNGVVLGNGCPFVFEFHCTREIPTQCAT